MLSLHLCVFCMCVCRFCHYHLIFFFFAVTVIKAALCVSIQRQPTDKARKSLILSRLGSRKSEHICLNLIVIGQ